MNMESKQEIVSLNKREKPSRIAKQNSKPIIEEIKEEPVNKSKKNITWKSLEPGNEECLECQNECASHNEMKKHECSKHKRNKLYFEYKVNDSKAKKKFLRGAKVTPLDHKHLSTCTMINFSVGAFSVIVLPFIKQLCDSSNVTLVNEEFSLNQVKQGYDQTGKNVETQVTINHNEYKVVLHLYTTGFNIKVDGKTAKCFSDKILIPYLRHNIEENLEKINNFNVKVLKELGETQNITSPKLKKFNCEQCGYESVSTLNLIKHKRSKHYISNEQAHLDFEFSSLAPKRIQGKRRHMASTPAPPPLPQRSRLILEDNHSTNISVNHTILPVPQEVININHDFTLNLTEANSKQNEESTSPNFKQRSKEELPIITNQIISESIYTCDRCSYEGKDFDTLYTHIISQHDNKSQVNLKYLNSNPTIFTANDNVYISSTSPITATTTIISDEIKEVNYENKCYFENECPQVSCGICAEVFISIQECSSHMDSCFLYNCEMCEFKTDEKDILKEHIMCHRTKMEVNLNCKLSDYETSRTDNLMKHKNMVHFECDKCEYQAEAKDELMEHINTVHVEHPVLLTMAIRDLIKSQSKLSRQMTYLTNEVFNLKTDSMMMSNQIQQVLKDDILDPITSNFEAKLSVLSEEVAKLTNKVEIQSVDMYCQGLQPLQYMSPQQLQQFWDQQHQYKQLQLNNQEYIQHQNNLDNWNQQQYTKNNQQQPYCPPNKTKPKTKLNTQPHFPYPYNSRPNFTSYAPSSQRPPRQRPLSKRRKPSGTSTVYCQPGDPNCLIYSGQNLQPPQFRRSREENTNHRDFHAPYYSKLNQHSLNKNNIQNKVFTHPVPSIPTKNRFEVLQDYPNKYWE